MKDFQVWLLVNGQWEFESKQIAVNRTAVLQVFHGPNRQSRNGCVKVRLLK